MFGLLIFPSNAIIIGRHLLVRVNKGQNMFVVPYMQDPCSPKAFGWYTLQKATTKKSN